MANCSAAKSSSHVVGRDIFIASFDISLLISGIIAFIFKLLQVLELRILA